jgi:hypothetical protein
MISAASTAATTSDETTDGPPTAHAGTAFGGRNEARGGRGRGGTN